MGEPAFLVCQACHRIVPAGRAKGHSCNSQEWCRRCGWHQDAPAHGPSGHRFRKPLMLSSARYLATDHDTKFIINWRTGILRLIQGGVDITRLRFVPERPVKRRG